MGISLVEVLIVSALITLVFGALISSFSYSVNLINNTEAKLSALSIANDRMEYIRSLPYADVGVIAGDPAGNIPQTSTTTLNGIEFIERVRIDWINDPGDDVAGIDGNGIIFDYKKVRLEYTWNRGGATSSVVLLSNIVPRSIETTTGGGTARIIVIDSEAGLLPGASVRLYGSSSTFPYDVTNFTNYNGEALFNVRADSGYQVEVTANISGDQYSTDQTYEATTTNPNPSVSPFTVLEADVSTLTFQIDELSDLDINTFSDWSDQYFREDFADLLSVASSSGVRSFAGELELANTLGVYDTSGVVYVGPINPAGLLGWDTVRVARDIPANTTQEVQLFTGVGTGPYTFTLIPEIDLPGNLAGFTDNIIDISELSTSVYSSIFVGINLTTSDTTVSPQVDEIDVYYRDGETSLGSVGFDIQGAKLIGTEDDASPIYKFTDSLTTDLSGEHTITDLEFDEYTLNISGGRDIASACPAHPFSHLAGINGNLDLRLVGGAANTLRVNVVDVTGRVLPGVEVNVNRTGYDVTQETDNCGQTFFTGGLIAEEDYEVNITAAGYVGQTIDPYEIDGDTFLQVIMTE